MSDVNPTGGAETDGRGATTTPTSTSSTSDGTTPQVETDGRGATTEPSDGGTTA